MPQFSDGQKINEALVWDRLIQSVPASYVIWKDSATFRAECLLKGGTDYNGLNASTVIQAAIDGLTKGQIYIKKETYPLGVGLTVSQKDVEIICESGTILQATAAIDMLTFYRVAYVNTGIKNATFDMNNVATKGLYLKDVWHSHSDDLRILNVGTNAHGVEIRSVANDWLCLSNYVRCRSILGYGYVQDGPPGSIGVLVDSDGGILAGTNNIVDVGYCKFVRTGIKNVIGASSTFRGIVEGCDIGADISGVDQTLDLHEEANTTYGIIIRTGSKAKGFIRAADNITVEGTGKFVYIDGDGMRLIATSTGDPPFIDFRVGGYYTIKLKPSIATACIDIKDSNEKIRAKIIADENAGGLLIHKGAAETELGGLIAGSSQNRPVLKFWDVTAAAYKYAYIDNGAWVIAASNPT